MCRVVRLVVLPDSDRVEQWILDESRAHDFVDLRQVCTFSQLLDLCGPALFAHRVVADELVTRLCFAQAAHATPGPFGDAAATPQFARQVCELVNELRRNDAEPWQLTQAAAKCDEPLQARAKALAEIWRHADAALDAKGLVAHGEWTRLASKRLETQGLPAALRGYARIEVRGLHDVPLSRLRLFKALSHACKEAHVAFAWHWPAAGESNIDAFIIDTVRQAEAGWAQEEFALEREEAPGPLNWIGAELFAASPKRAPAPELSAFMAPTSQEEARELARRVRRSISAGVPAESIAIVFRELASDTEVLLEALDGFGVPARARLGVPLGRTARGRVALKLLELAGEDFPADDVAQVLECSAVTLLPAEAAAPRRTFREAGVRDDELGREGARGAYDVRLQSLTARAGERARAVELLREATGRLLSLCRELKTEATAHEFLDAWWDVVTKLMPDAAPLLTSPRSAGGGNALPLPAKRGEGRGEGPSSIHTELLKAEALDAAAARALKDLLASLKHALRLSGYGKTKMSRRDFARLVRDAAEDVNLLAAGPRAGAVWLLEARELAERRFAQLFVGGLHDGRWPRRAAPVSILTEEERVTLNRHLGKTLFRVFVGENDVQLSAGLAEDRLLFHFALSAGASVTLSRARFDDRGREVLASPFIDALERVVDGFAEEPVRRAAVASLDEVQSEAELRVRVALEALSPAVTRQTVPDARGPALRVAFEQEPWFQRAKSLGEAEAERLRFFSDNTQPPGPYSGQLDGAALTTLRARLTFDEQHPLSAHELQNWARCSFRGLTAAALKLEVPEHPGEDLDARARGQLWHDALADAVPKLRDAKLLGRFSDAAAALVKESVQHAAERLSRNASTGHPALWSLAQEWAVKVITRVVCSSNAKPFGLPSPAFFEVDFGIARAPSELREVKLPIEPPVFLRGRMDRVDLAPGSIGVIDYKSSVSKTVMRDFLVTEFQLALYLFAAQHLDASAQVTGAWLGLGRNELKTLSRPTEEVLSELPAAVTRVLEPLRGGDFGARPALECGMCEFKPVCRISQRKLIEDVP